MREGEVHADRVLEHEGFAVLPDHTGADAALLKLAYRDAVLAAPIGAVEIEKEKKNGRKREDLIW